VSLVFWALKYFLLAEPDVRRFLRQELERLKLETAVVFKEVQKYDLERVDTSLDRFRPANEKQKPSDQQAKGLCPG
jgi:hypothetical protein